MSSYRKITQQKARFLKNGLKLDNYLIIKSILLLVPKNEYRAYNHVGCRFAKLCSPIVLTFRALEFDKMRLNSMPPKLC